ADRDPVAKHGVGSARQGPGGWQDLDAARLHADWKRQVAIQALGSNLARVTEPSAQALVHVARQAAGSTKVVNLDTHWKLNSSTRTSRIFSEPSGNRKVLNWS